MAVLSALCDQTSSLAPVPGYCSNMNDYHTQHYLSARGNNVLAIRLVNIDIGDGDDHKGKPPQECLSDQETDIEEEIHKSIAGPAGKGDFRVKKGFS